MSIVVKFARKLTLNLQKLGIFDMKPAKTNNDQQHLFKSRLSNQLNLDHELILLSKHIDWDYLHDQFEPLFDEHFGAPAKAVQEVIGIIILQQMYGFSDERVVKLWIENPYWQYFCGHDYLQSAPPLHPSSLGKWRKRLGEEGLEVVLGVTLSAALSTSALKKKALKKLLQIRQ